VLGLHQTKQPSRPEPPKYAPIPDHEFRRRIVSPIADEATVSAVKNG
jgi:hypothetical protein